jgi:alpha-glucoside transport system substrate-binding protein
VDIWLSPQPANVHDLDQDAGLVDLTTYLDRDELLDAYAPYLLGLVSHDDGRVLAVPVDADLKGLVWYPPERFARAGLDTPETWDQLVTLSTQIAATGSSPWCVGWMDDSGGGWPGTDWIESLVLRNAGLETYDRWAQHELPFDAPAVVEAFAELDELLEQDGFVLFGRSAVDDVPWYLSMINMFPEGGGGCWLTHGSDLFDPSFAHEIDFFPLPAPAGGAADTFFGGGNFASAVTDRPETRALIEFMASDAWGHEWARSSIGGFLSPRRDFESSWYGPEDSPAAQHRRAAATLLLDSLASGTWRFDASDLMPIEIGSFTDDGEGGAFFRAALQFGSGELTPGEAASQIERAWLRLEEREAAARLRADCLGMPLGSCGRSGW